jgi:hypothetical protein
VQTEADNAAIMARVNENERLAEQQAEDNQRIKKGYDDEIAQIRAAGAVAGTGRLRIPATVCSGSAPAAQATAASGSAAAATGTVALPEAIDRDLRALMVEADSVVASCRAAQEYVRGTQ